VSAEEGLYDDGGDYPHESGVGGGDGIVGVWEGGGGLPRVSIVVRNVVGGVDLGGMMTYGSVYVVGCGIVVWIGVDRYQVRSVVRSLHRGGGPSTPSTQQRRTQLIVVVVIGVRS